MHTFISSKIRIIISLRTFFKNMHKDNTHVRKAITRMLANTGVMRRNEGVKMVLLGCFSQIEILGVLVLGAHLAKISL